MEFFEAVTVAVQKISGYIKADGEFFDAVRQN
jgi:hypothetical protein